jgi:hypothetical protein
MVIVPFRSVVLVPSPMKVPFRQPLARTTKSAHPSHPRTSTPSAEAVRSGGLVALHLDFVNLLRDLRKIVLHLRNRPATDAAAEA